MDDDERRFFTLREATALLPQVTELLAKLRTAVQLLEEVRERIAVDGEVERPVCDSPVDPGHYHAVARFHDAASHFHDLGIEVKDVGRGLIDFPALLEGEEIRLCWQDGEESINWYHDLESGFSGRKPIASLRPGAEPLLDGDDE